MFLTSRLLLRIEPLRSNLAGSSKRLRSGSGGGDSEAARCLIWAALYLLASALIMGRSEEAVSLEASEGGLL